MSRTYVSTIIRQLCAAARVPEEKGNPRCLKRLYQSTRTGIEENIAFLVEHAHNRLLEQEQQETGWAEEYVGGAESGDNTHPIYTAENKKVLSPLRFQLPGNVSIQAYL